MAFDIAASAREEIQIRVGELATRVTDKIAQFGTLVESYVHQSSDRYIIRRLAAAGVDYTQRVLEGELGNHYLSHYYKHPNLNKKVPRYIGGMHYQEGHLLKSIHYVRMSPAVYAVGSNLDYAEDVHNLDRAEVGRSYLEQGVDMAKEEIIDYVRDLGGRQ